MLTIKRLDLADAQAMIAAARASAEKMGVPTCIAVTDESGALIAFERMDGAKTIGVTIAVDKAFTAAGTRKATHELSAAVQPGAPAYGLITSHGGRLIVLPGGVPVVVDGVVIGAIGVSTGTPDQDLEVAQAGVKAFTAPA
jgi:uncharacterized protein GlcG (DUF336 family)